MDADSDLESLLDGYRRKGFVFAVRILGNGDDAADAVQDGLRALWQHRDEIRCKQEPHVWFFRVLRNRCIDQLRKRRLRRQESLDMDGSADSHSPGPAAAAQCSEFDAHLRSEVERLDAKYREIVLLRDFLDLSYAQIGEVLSLAPGTVMSRLHRARMILRDRLKDLL